MNPHLDLKWFIVGNVAIFRAPVYKWASEYIFEEEEDEDTLDQTDLRLQF